ncbi:hypothetical protein AD2_01670 [Acetivibrio thermocellus AD2]|nr:hypothetical protein AD2_01670 [Acetivibrio thermocellus AD2]ANV76412.1 hypothetical protein LQRI_1671 [Acetivibrio thermocellus DSM 2360]EIC05302.1 hypothetical protein YSBL_0979 [Acetivibrio thermocellus YS]
MQVLWGLYRTYEELKLLQEVSKGNKGDSLYRTYEELKLLRIWLGIYTFDGFVSYL